MTGLAFTLAGARLRFSRGNSALTHKRSHAHLLDPDPPTLPTTLSFSYRCLQLNVILAHR